MSLRFFLFFSALFCSEIGNGKNTSMKIHNSSGLPPSNRHHWKEEASSSNERSQILLVRKRGDEEEQVLINVDGLKSLNFSDSHNMLVNIINENEVPLADHPKHTERKFEEPVNADKAHAEKKTIVETIKPLDISPRHSSRDENTDRKKGTKPPVHSSLGAWSPDKAAAHNRAPSTTFEPSTMESKLKHLKQVWARKLNQSKEVNLERHQHGKKPRGEGFGAGKNQGRNFDPRQNLTKAFERYNVSHQEGSTHGPKHRQEWLKTVGARKPIIYSTASNHAGHKGKQRAKTQESMAAVPFNHSAFHSILGDIFFMVRQIALNITDPLLLEELAPLKDEQDNAYIVRARRASLGDMTVQQALAETQKLHVFDKGNPSKLSLTTYPIEIQIGKLHLLLFQENETEDASATTDETSLGPPVTATLTTSPVALTQHLVMTIKPPDDSMRHSSRDENTDRRKGLTHEESPRTALSPNPRGTHIEEFRRGSRLEKNFRPTFSPTTTKEPIGEFIKALKVLELAMRSLDTPGPDSAIAPWSSTQHPTRTQSTGRDGGKGHYGMLAMVVKDEGGPLGENKKEGTENKSRGSTGKRNKDNKPDELPEPTDAGFLNLSILIVLAVLTVLVMILVIKISKYNRKTELAPSLTVIETGSAEDGTKIFTLRVGERVSGSKEKGTGHHSVTHSVTNISALPPLRPKTPRASRPLQWVPPASPASGSARQSRSPGVLKHSTSSNYTNRSRSRGRSNPESREGRTFSVKGHRLCKSTSPMAAESQFSYASSVCTEQWPSPPAMEAYQRAGGFSTRSNTGAFCADRVTYESDETYGRRSQSPAFSRVSGRSYNVDPSGFYYNMQSSCSSLQNQDDY
nr:PREDICTED: uncharacterized protein LOC102354091 [Latimeria chalumnae]|eukprot:XP_006004961.2 PREDICTED: uncharacterized protein LOC102354091 [Latimeria chalumnae]